MSPCRSLKYRSGNVVVFSVELNGNVSSTFLYGRLSKSLLAHPTMSSHVKEAAEGQTVSKEFASVQFASVEFVPVEFVSVLLHGVSSDSCELKNSSISEKLR